MSPPKPFASGAKPWVCTQTGIVFALDASSSIDRVEYSLQLLGLGAALRTPEVVDAIKSAGGLSVAVAIWADHAYGVQVVAWEQLFDADDASRFAARIAGLSRLQGGNTDIGVGLSKALDLLSDPGLCLTHRVVDISGDGRESFEPRRKVVSLQAARLRAETLGVVVNGLAVTGEDPGLSAYYREHVATGRGAFVLEVSEFADFATAMRAKLLREMAPSPIAQLDGSAGLP